MAARQVPIVAKHPTTSRAAGHERPLPRDDHQHVPFHLTVVADRTPTPVGSTIWECRRPSGGGHDGPVLADRPEDLSLDRQIDYLQRALRQNPVAEAVFAAAGEMHLPGWYLGAGAVAQTV